MTHLPLEVVEEESEVAEEAETEELIDEYR
jgi:hypothetical protein